MSLKPILRTLFVEDNPTDVFIVEKALSVAKDLQLSVKHRLADAIKFLKAEPIDVVLLDLGLPDSQGLESLRKLRQTNPDITVVVLTGQDDEVLAKQALQEGAQDVLAKGRMEFGALERVIRYAAERVKNEAAIKQGEERFRLLVEGVSDHVLVLLDPVGRIVTWNNGAKNILGYEEQEIIGQSYSRFFTAEDAAAGRHEEVLQVAASNGQCRIEGWRVRKNGSRYWSSGIVNGLFRDEGSLRGFAAITRDLTENTITQDALRESEEQLRLALVAAFGNGVLLPMPSTGISKY